MKMKKVTFYISAKDHKNLKSIAKKSGQSISEVVRDILRKVQK